MNTKCLAKIGMAIAMTTLSFFLVAMPPAAQAANNADFDPGYIIDDLLFYDGSLMPEASIQAFLESKLPTCSTTAGNPGCMKDYRADSAPRVADRYCGAYEGGVGELASRIIFEVSMACNINPQVLLVSLQKEQGLVTATNPSPNKYRIAMGYGCPDTAACDTRYYGFANQLISAARQFNYYASTPNESNYRPGRVNTIQWHPNAACGISEVFIKNKATAGLYRYTPYRPNAAAINAGYGSGDTCSSYGNRNFWAYFTDWFGSTTVSSGSISFVRSLYSDILSRTPANGEIAFWGRQLMSGVGRATVASGFVNSDEYRLQRITSAYRSILLREGELQGVQNWLDLMKVGAVETDDVDKYFFASDEYFLRAGATNPGFVSSVYRDLLGRAVSPAEIPFWTNIVEQSGRGAVIEGIWRSIESARARVTVMYGAYLGRYPEEAGVQSWAAMAIQSGDAIVRWRIMGSEEYWLRASARFPI